MEADSKSLLELLAAHPAVFMPKNREPHYFSAEYYYPSFYYRSLFKGRNEQQICGEASTSYSDVNRFPRCPERIANDAPNVRIIYLIRDPVERILLNLRDLSGRGHEIDINAKALTDNDLWDTGRYRDTIEAYLEFFPRSRLLVADLKDLQNDDEWLPRLMRFLELDDQPDEDLTLPHSDAQEAHDAEISDIAADALRKRFPDRCAHVESQYRWARKNFLDLSGKPIPVRDESAEPETLVFGTLSMQADIKPATQSSSGKQPSRMGRNLLRKRLQLDRHDESERGRDKPFYSRGQRHRYRDSLAQNHSRRSSSSDSADAALKPQAAEAEPPPVVTEPVEHGAVASAEPPPSHSVAEQATDSIAERTDSQQSPVDTEQADDSTAHPKEADLPPLVADSITEPKDSEPEPTPPSDSPEPMEDIVAEPTMRISQPADRGERAALWTVIPWVLLGMFILPGTYYLVVGDDDPAVVAEEFEEVSDPPAAEVTSEISAPPQKQESAAAPAAAPAEPLPPSGTAIPITFRFLEDCWAEVSDAQRRRIYDLEKAGTESSFNGVLPLKIFLGNASAVEIEINGKAFKIPASARTPAGTLRFTINEADLQ